MEIPEICCYCGGTVRVYGAAAAKRLKLEKEMFYQCQNCNARVGCHRGSKRPLGNLANEVLRLKRMETHQVYDAFWKSKGMIRTQAYKWLAERMQIPEQQAHIGSFEMDQCQRVIDLCREYEDLEVA